MQRRVFRPTDDPAAFPGAVLCRDVSVRSNGRSVTVRRGVSLVEALERLPAEDGGRPTVPLQIVVPEPGELAQPEASLLVARAIAGDGVAVPDPHQGQVSFQAATRGLLRVRADAVRDLNRSAAALVATALDGRVAEKGETIGIVKAPALFVPRAEIDQALARAGEEPVVRVAPLQVRQVGLLAGERIRPRNLEVASTHLAAGLQRLDADLTDIRHIDDEPDQIAAAYRRMIDGGVGLLMVAGTIVLDPEDPFLIAVERAGGRVVRRGAPIEPGTMFWVAYIGDVPLLGLASCELYGRISVLELLLPYALAGEPITDELMAELGYGGLLDDTQPARRPAGWYG